MSKKKKIVILSCMVLLLAVTAVCNFLLADKSGVDDTVATANYFTEYRTEHTKTLNEQILQLDGIIPTRRRIRQRKNKPFKPSSSLRI